MSLVIQETTHVSRYPEVRYRDPDSPPYVPFLSHTQSTHSNPIIRSFLILSSHLRLGLPSGHFPQASPQNPTIHLSSIRATCPVHLTLTDFFTLITADKREIIKNGPTGLGNCY